jgi:hypothetical protein
VFAGPRIALMQVLQARASAADLRARVLDHIARETKPELADVRVIRGRADFDPMMPPFITAYLSYLLPT